MPSDKQKRLRWFAVRCDSSRVVIKAGVGIARLGVHVLIPRLWRMERRGDWLHPVADKLMFPPFLFVRTSSDGPWAEIKEVDGVRKILGCKDGGGDFKPLPIRHQEMRPVISSQRVSGPVRVEEQPKKARVVSKSFADLRSIINKLEAQREIELDEDEVRAA